MSSKSWKILESLTSRINKSPILSGAIESAAGHAQVHITNIQNIATKKYDTIVKHIPGTTIIQDLKAASLEPTTPIPRKLVDWWKWYQQLTGLEDIELAKRQMIIVQDKLFNCQDQRRGLTNEASSIAEKLKEIYSELIQTRREDPKYVQLTIMENKALREQSRIMSQMNFLENEERDYFTQLATSIKEYHDSQAMNAQKYKYLSILASAVIAILSLGGSMIYNNKRIANVHKIIADGQEKNEILFREHFSSLEKSVQAVGNLLIDVQKSPIKANDFPSTKSQENNNKELFFAKAIAVGSLGFLLYLWNR
ncbi:hypothetical protein PV327_004988 [Microctonus hyperodae]|uniref:Coiled-coil domain-containing protein 51 n=1 Tax=Microctonus hyperodae TaxID=165561 RepID=A0AA39FDY7_MICHY|nr:hypothetical protein PV327_004988 [Microctonus hyperodae]